MENIGEFLASLFKQELSLDLGSSKIALIDSLSDKKLIEPSYISIELRDGFQNIKAVGTKAKALLDKSSPFVKTSNPIERGAIKHDVEITKLLETFFRSFHKGAWAKRLFSQSDVIVPVSDVLTETDKKIITILVEDLGGGRVMPVNRLICSAIYKNLPVSTNRGVLVADLGHGICDVALIAEGNIVAQSASKSAGSDMDSNIIEHFRSTHNMRIGLMTAERIKHSIAVAHMESSSDDKSMNIEGIDIAERKVKRIRVCTGEIFKCVSGSLNDIRIAINKTIESIPAEYASSIKKDGIYITGGVSNLKYIEKMITMSTGLHVNKIENPSLSAALGASKLQKKLRKEKKLVFDGD